MIRNAKRRYFLHNISSSSVANIWKFLGTLGIGKQRQYSFQSAIGLDDINAHFTTSIPLDYQSTRRTVEFLEGLSPPNIDPFKFSTVSMGEIKKIILSIRSNAVGHDGVSRQMIVLILDCLLPSLQHLINSSLSSGTFPVQWRKAFVIPLPKVSNPTLPTHFRPISILPFLSKVLEACVHNQLSQFVHKNGLINSLQSGFRPGHSTVSALLKVTGDIRAGMEDTKVTLLALVDFSNAFNTVSHEILLSILSYLMISPEVLKWFTSYLRGRQQSVRIDESSSSWRDLDTGVPQGGILSPLLFSLFINLITQSLQCSYHLYADDLQLYSQATVDCVSEAVRRVNGDLEAICDWSGRFGLTVNPTKCQAIIIGSPRLLGRLDFSSLPPVTYNGAIIPLSPSVKNLGLYMDSRLDWAVQVLNVSRKVTGSLRALYRFKNFLPFKIKLMLVQALILPIIDYGDVCYLDLNADLLNKLDRLLNNCIRFIFNLRKYDHVSTYRSEINFLPIRERRNLHALTALHSILTCPTPPSYLTQYFKYLHSSHDKDLRSSNNLLLHCPTHHSSLVRSSFVVQSVQLWNSLPLNVRMITDRLTFKIKVRQLFLEKLKNLTI